MKFSMKRFIDCEKGATAIEYALIAALISVAIIAATSSLGEAIEGVFNDIEVELKNATE